MMLQRIYALLMAAILALPVYAQDAGPLALGVGMRAYTTRVFVEPEVLAALSVGDEVSFFTTYFTAWDYPHTEGFEDTYVVDAVAQNLKILAVEIANGPTRNAPLVEVLIRVEGISSDIKNLVLSGYYEFGSSSVLILAPRRVDITQATDLSESGMVVMVSDSEVFPQFCHACETLLLEAYYLIFANKQKECYRTLRRGVNVTRMVVPCRDD